MCAGNDVVPRSIVFGPQLAEGASSDHIVPLAGDGNFGPMTDRSTSGATQWVALRSSRLPNRSYRCSSPVKPGSPPHTGSRIVILVPAPTVLSAEIVPPCALHDEPRDRQPQPELILLASRRVRPRYSLSKIYGSASGAMPLPIVDHLQPHVHCILHAAPPA